MKGVTYLWIILCACKYPRAEDISATKYRTVVSGREPSLSRWTIDWVENSSYCDDKARTSQISTKHEVQDKEAILVVLEGISQIYNEGMVDLDAVSGEWWMGFGIVLTSSNNLRSCMMLLTARILTHLDLLMYLSAYRSRVCLC